MLEVIKISTYGIKQSYLNCLLCGNKVNELSRENLSQQQIAIKIGIHRDTVRRYQIMSESEFNEHLNRESTPPSGTMHSKFIATFSSSSAARFLSMSMQFHHSPHI